MNIVMTVVITDETLDVCCDFVTVVINVINI